VYVCERAREREGERATREESDVDLCFAFFTHRLIHICRVPHPPGDPKGTFRGLLFDSWFDSYKGVVLLVEVGEFVLLSCLCLTSLALSSLSSCHVPCQVILSFLSVSLSVSLCLSLSLSFSVCVLCVCVLLSLPCAVLCIMAGDRWLLEAGHEDPVRPHWPVLRGVFVCVCVCVSVCVCVCVCLCVCRDRDSFISSTRTQHKQLFFT
jgi:hypothetical protein